jgi:hypothetical protein
MALHIKLHKDKHGNEICLFTCDHQQLPRVIMDDQACRPAIVGGDVYRCSMELRHLHPRKEVNNDQATANHLRRLQSGRVL